MSSVETVVVPEPENILDENSGTDVQSIDNSIHFQIYSSPPAKVSTGSQTTSSSFVYTNIATTSTASLEKSYKRDVGVQTKWPKQRRKLTKDVKLQFPPIKRHRLPRKNISWRSLFHAKIINDGVVSNNDDSSDVEDSENDIVSSASLSSINSESSVNTEPNIVNIEPNIVNTESKIVNTESKIVNINNLITDCDWPRLLEFDLCCQFACFIQNCCKVETIDFVANNDTICSYCKVETIGFGVNNDTI